MTYVTDVGFLEAYYSWTRQGDGWWNRANTALTDKGQKLEEGGIALRIEQQ